LNGESIIALDSEKNLGAARDSEMPAMRSAADLIALAGFADQNTLHPLLVRSIETLTAQDAES
jgi:hypothetical protein